MHARAFLIRPVITLADGTINKHESCLVCSQLNATGYIAPAARRRHGGRGGGKARKYDDIDPADIEIAVIPLHGTGNMICPACAMGP